MTSRKILLLFLLIHFRTFAAEIDLTGIYQGKNLYVQNPLNITSKKYCVEQVFLNDVKILSNIESSAFEIDLSELKINESINIRIVHNEYCAPKILNPHVIKSNVAFNFTSFNVVEEAISWTTKGENMPSKFYLEHYVNGNWITEEALTAKGKDVINDYKISLLHHSGTNKYRIKYMEQGEVVFYSQVIEYKSSLTPLQFYPKRITDKLTFSRQAYYEITDNEGNLLLKGKEKEVNLSDLPEGVYYLNSDNKLAKIYKK